jgi:hypothetical protein
MDSLGRRKTIMVGAVLNLIGAVLQASAQNLAMVLVGRIMAGWAVGVLSMSVPIYQSECAHPKTRGIVHFPCTVQSMLTSHRSHRWYCPADDWCRIYRVYLGWIRGVKSTGYERIFLEISIGIPVSAMSHAHIRHNVLPRVAAIPGTFDYPPRFVYIVEIGLCADIRVQVETDRADDALVVLKKLHYNGSNDDWIQTEFNEIKLTIDAERAITAPGWRVMFTVPAWRTRLMHATLIQLFGQMTGCVYSGVNM